MSRWRLVAFLVMALWAGGAWAHALAPALLELTHRDAGQYEVLWRLSAIQAAGNTPQPVLPEGCKSLTAPSVTIEPGAAVTSRWRVECGNVDLAGETISVTNLAGSGINVILRLSIPPQPDIQTLLDARHSGFTVPAASEQTPVFIEYLGLGARHLWFGPDHLLFVLGLLLLVRGLRRLVLTLTAFTVGHSITLSLAALGVIHIDQDLMEFGIALSLIVLARELLRKEPSLLGRHPALMAVSFGLLHGLGFAGALAETGLPQQAIVPALLAFNIGIELAQLVVAGIALGGLWMWRMLQGNSPFEPQTAGYALPAYCIGTMAALWCIERMDAFQTFMTSIV